MAHRLSSSAACGIFPDQGSNPCPLHWQADSQPLRHQGSPQPAFLSSPLYEYTLNALIIQLKPFFFSFNFFLKLFIYLFMAVLGLRFCARASSTCGKRGPLFIAVRGPLTIAASLVAEHRLQTRRLSSCGSRA